MNERKIVDCTFRPPGETPAKPPVPEVDCGFDLDRVAKRETQEPEIPEDTPAATSNAAGPARSRVR